MLLVPLYLLVQKDLHLDGVAQVSWIVTVYGVVYFLGSYFAGIAADRFDRKVLLGFGLLGNAAAITLMGFTHRYEFLVALAVVSGICGTVFHPAANSLVPEHYPNNPGMAIGILGIGSGLGFWAGPWFVGRRVATATWQFAGVSDWQRPLVEAGLAGFVIGIIFLFVAREARGSKPSSPHAHETKPSKRNSLGRPLALRTIAVALVLGFRDMGGIATLSLVSIYLLKAFNLPAKQVGFVLGTMTLSATVINPLMVYFTPGKLRLPALSIVMLISGAVITTLPHWPLPMVLPVLCVFMGFQLGSYAISDAAMAERVPARSRGRVTGLFLLWAGSFSSCGPWIIGHLTDRLGPSATDPHAYTTLFFVMGVCMWIGACSSPLIAKLGRVGVSPPIDPFTETSPATMSAVG